MPCNKRNARPLKPHMSELPLNLTSIQLFTFVSLDFFGPIKVKRGRAIEKWYVLLIVCNQVHAIHLELCETFSTDHVLTAIQRFVVAKRMPKRIRSDQGTSFIAARKVICPGLSIEDIDWKNIQEKIYEVDWQFCTAYSASTNVAETFVGLVKKRLDLDLRDRVFHRDQLVTLLALAENSVNNRPLTYLSEDIDANPITANMLMKPLFKSDTSLQINTKGPMKYRKYFEDVLQIAESIATKWMEDFSQEIKKYPKWKTWTDNIKEGDLVLVMEMKNPLKQKNWPLGIVHKVIPSSTKPNDPDKRKEVVRKCLVRYRTSSDGKVDVYLRHTRHLIPLNLWNHWNE